MDNDVAKEVRLQFTRREFLFLGGATGAVVAIGVLVPIGLASRETVAGDQTAAIVGFFPRVKVASLSELEEGAPVLFDYPQVGQSSILVKMGEPVIGGVGPDGDIVAFSRLCTHMGCAVSEYQHEYKVLGPCPCHYSTFDLVHGGMVTLGQATQNLPQLLLSVDDDDVYADGVFRLVYGFDNTLQGGELVGGTV